MRDRAPPPNPYAPPARPRGTRRWSRSRRSPRATPPSHPDLTRFRAPWLRRRAGGLRRWKPLLVSVAGLAAAALSAALAGGFRYQDLATVPLPEGGPAGAAAHGKSARSSARSAPARLERLIAAQRPPGIHIAVDTLANRLYLKRGDEVVREAVCSTGTGGMLEDPASGRRWVFDTPRGSHRVRSKVEDPVWNKPDWAFIEEGQPIPRDAAERVDTFSLGDYALYLGDGYIIHGTLYQRLLGRSVTHGCVRLGDEDLEAVYRAAPIGTRVYIY